jgi:hypothetical protein
LTGTARNVDFCNSPYFKHFLQSILNLYASPINFNNNKGIKGSINYAESKFISGTGTLHASKFRVVEKNANHSPSGDPDGRDTERELSPPKENQNLLHRERRKSLMSNYNRRTYNKETVTERYFGPYIVQQSKFSIE